MARKRRDVPWLEQRANGVWYALKYDVTKRRTIRQSLETKDATEAQLHFARVLIEGFRAAGIVGNAGITVSQALDSYFDEHVRVNVADKCRQDYAITHLKAYFKATPFVEVDIAMSRAYLAARLSGAIGKKRRCGSPSTVRRELVVLIAAANHASRHRRIGPNAKPMTAMPQIELPLEGRRTQRTLWLPKDTLARVFAAADCNIMRSREAAVEADARATHIDASHQKPSKKLRAKNNALHMWDSHARLKKFAAFLRIAYFTAARRHSVEKLMRPQVDLAHSLLHLDPAGATLTNKRRPTVPIYPEIRPHLERLLAETNDIFLFGGIPDFYRDFVNVCADLGIKANPHMLRHSRATHMLMDGEDVYKVARLLGDNVQTVLQTYAHATVDYLKTSSTIEEVA